MEQSSWPSRSRSETPPTERRDHDVLFSMPMVFPFDPNIGAHRPFRRGSTTIPSTSSSSASGSSRTPGSSSGGWIRWRSTASSSPPRSATTRSSCCATATRCAASTTSACIAPGRSRTGCGKRNTLQCKYHGWTYTLDGDAAARAGDGRRGAFHARGHAAPCPSRSTTWGPLVFVNLDGKAPPLSDVARRHPESRRGVPTASRCAT